MATSGSVNFTQNRLEVLEDTLTIIGVKGVGKTVSTEDMLFCNNMLNGMIKAWANKGIHLWTLEEAVLFCTPNIGEYTLGTAAADAHCARWLDTVLTKISTAAADAATSLTVDTTTGMTVGDVVGVVLDDDTTHWTTIATIPTSTTLTLTAALTDSAAANNNVYTYTNKINKPLKIHTMRRTTNVDDDTSQFMLEISMGNISMEQFSMIPNKNLSGPPNNYYYRPELTSTRLQFWPRPDSSRYFFRFTYSRIMEDLDSSTDNFDLPQEWLEVLKYQLAVRIASAFGKAQLVMTLLAPMASAMLDEMIKYDDDSEIISITPFSGD